jgi:hypothetical protein
MKTTTPKRARRDISRNAVIARKILAQKYGASYIPLVCGHFTDTETANRNGKYQGKYFCETCGKHRRRQPKKMPPPLPDEPMF